MSTVSVIRVTGWWESVLHLFLNTSHIYNLCKQKVILFYQITEIIKIMNLR